MSGAIADIDLELTNTPRGFSAEGRNYFLEIKAKNNTSFDLSQYRIEVEFPKSFLNLHTSFAAEVRDRSTPTHMFFRNTHEEHANRIIYSGDSQIQISIDYYVNEQSYRNAGQLPVRIRFLSAPHRQVKETSIAELIPQFSQS